MQRMLHIALTAVVLSFSAGIARAQETPVNQVLGIEAHDLAESTEITILGSSSPTFSVYRLNRPARIFVDFSNSELTGDITNWAVRNGLVDEVLVLQYRDDVSLVTRVVIALERDDAEYDIDTGPTSVTVRVTADGWASPQTVAAAQAEERRQEGDRVAELEAAARLQEAQRSAAVARVAELEAELARQRTMAATSSVQLQSRSEELDELETEVGAIEARESSERTRADRLAGALADVETDLAEARASELTARGEMTDLSRQSAALETEILSLTALLSERDLVAEELVETRARQEALEAELRGILDEQEDAEAALAEASRGRERYEQQALEVQGELSSARGELERLRGERSVAESQVAQSRAELEQTEAQVSVRRTEQIRIEAALAESHLEQDALTAELAAAELERRALQAELAERRLERETLDAELAATEAERQMVQAELVEAAAERARIATELSVAQDRRDRLQSDLRRAGERRAEVDAELATAMAELATAVTQREEMDTELAAAREERDRIDAELAAAEAQRARIDVELAEAASEHDRLEAELAEAATRRERIESDLDRAGVERDVLYAELDRAAQERERLNEELVLLESDHEAEAAALAEIADRRAAIEAEIARLRGQRSDASGELDAVEAQQRAAAQQLARLEAERAAVSDEIAGVESRREVEASELARLEAQRADAQLSLAGITTQRETLAGDIGAMEARLASLRAETEVVLAEHASERLDDQRLAQERAEATELAALEAERQRRQALEGELARQNAALAAAEAELAVREAELAERERASAGVAGTVLASNPGRSERDAPETERVAQDHSVNIVDVRFSQLNGVDRIEVEFDGPAPSVESLPWRDGRAGLVIPQAELPESMHRTLDTRAFGGPVQFVSTYTDESGEVRLVADLTEAASEILSRDGNVAHWEFSSVEAQLAENDVEEVDAEAGFEGYNSQESPSTAPPIRRPQGTTYTIGRRRDQIRTPSLSRRFRVTIDVVNADIQNVLRLFSDQGDVNIIASGNVEGNITLRLRDVPLDLAFALILQSQGLGFEQRGNIIRVAPMSEFEQERQRELQRIAEAFDVEPLQVRLRPISYANGDGLITLLADILSSRGTAAFDERTHTMILTDVAENLDAADQLIDALDTQTPQVLVEARIVQTSETFSQAFGIQWGGDALFSAANGNPTGLLFPSTVGIAGGAGQTPNQGTAATPNYAVNLPGPSNGAIGFQFGSLGQSVNLNLRLTAAESTGEAKVISAPRVLTLDGQSASISQGVSIPVQTVGAAGANVTFIQANLSLTVIPVVTPDGFVRLDLTVTKNEPDFARTGANGDPTIRTNSARTNLLVRDGETSVIGGIFEHLQGSDQNAVPFFADIPILGALFHDYSFQDERNELLIFITPRIVNRDLALTNYAPGGVLMTPPSE